MPWNENPRNWVSVGPTVPPSVLVVASPVHHDTALCLGTPVLKEQQAIVIKSGEAVVGVSLELEVIGVLLDGQIIAEVRPKSSVSLRDSLVNLLGHFLLIVGIAIVQVVLDDVPKRLIRADILHSSANRLLSAVVPGKLEPVDGWVVVGDVKVLPLDLLHSLSFVH